MGKKCDRCQNVVTRRISWRNQKLCRPCAEQVSYYEYEKLSAMILGRKIGVARLDSREDGEHG